MEPWARMEFQALVLAVATRSVARAGDNDWDHRFFKFSDPFPSTNPWKPKNWPPPTPPWFIAAVVFMVIFFLVTFIAFLLCHLRRRRMLMAQQTLVPPPLAPVTAGAPMYPGQQPFVSGAMMPPPAPYPPQQHGFQPQATPYTQAPLYAAQNVDSLQRPYAPAPLAPLDPPPPYNFETSYKQ